MVDGDVDGMRLNSVDTQQLPLYGRCQLQDWVGGTQAIEEHASIAPALLPSDKVSNLHAKQDVDVAMNTVCSYQ